MVLQIPASPRPAIVPLTDPAEVLRGGLTDLVELFARPDWSPRMKPLLSALTTMALGSDDDAAILREGIRVVLGSHPRAEMVPEAVIVLLQRAAERHQP